MFLSNAHFRVVVAGRRFGKTELALAEMLRAALGEKKIVWYVGPNGHQSKPLIWDRLKELTRPYWAKPPSETHLRIDLACDFPSVADESSGGLD